MFSREYIEEEEEETECTAARTDRRSSKTGKTTTRIVPIVNSRFGCSFTPRNCALFIYRAACVRKIEGWPRPRASI